MLSFFTPHGDSSFESKPENMKTGKLINNLIEFALIFP